MEQDKNNKTNNNNNNCSSNKTLIIKINTQQLMNDGQTPCSQVLDKRFLNPHTDRTGDFRKNKIAKITL